MGPPGARWRIRLLSGGDARTLIPQVRSPWRDSALRASADAPSTPRAAGALSPAVRLLMAAGTSVYGDWLTTVALLVLLYRVTHSPFGPALYMLARVARASWGRSRAALSLTGLDRHASQPHAPCSRESSPPPSSRSLISTSSGRSTSQSRLLNFSAQPRSPATRR